MDLLLTTSEEDFDIYIIGFDNQNDMDVYKEHIPQSHLIFRGNPYNVIEPIFKEWVDKQECTKVLQNKHGEMWSDTYMNYYEFRTFKDPYQFDNPIDSYKSALKKLGHPDFILVIKKDEKYE